MPGLDCTLLGMASTQTCNLPCTLLLMQIKVETKPWKIQVGFIINGVG